MQCACAILSSVVSPALQYFSKISHKQQDFFWGGGKLLHIKCVFLFSKTCWNISHSKKNWAGYDQKCTLVFMQNTRYSCQILIQTESSPKVFEKYSKCKTKWKSVLWERSFSKRTVGRTDRQTWLFFAILWTCLNTHHWMLHRAKFAVCSAINTKHKVWAACTIWNVKSVGALSDCWALLKLYLPTPPFKCYNLQTF